MSALPAFPSAECQPATIRAAAPADAPEIAAIHVRAWRDAYRGIVPDHVIDGHSVEEREQMWSSILLSGHPHGRVWVAETATGLVGFCSTGPGRDLDAVPEIAEVWTLYLDPACKGRGIGRLLFDHAVEDLERRGFIAATLWVISANQNGRRFYEAAGWCPDGVTHVTEDGHETRYRIALPRRRPS